jgi:uncharacterized membrane protein
MLRGLVIVVMALDHVRDFFNYGGERDPMANPNIGTALFFTRWITHFCAPVFVFLAGTSAGLMTARKTPSELGAFLFKRGVWLISIECVVVSTAWSFAPWGIQQLDGRVGVVMQVIWAIGASMVILAGAQFLGQRVPLIGGRSWLVTTCSIRSGLFPKTSSMLVNQVGRYAPDENHMGPFSLWAYPLLPWIGVMLLGSGPPALPGTAAEARCAAACWGAAATMAFVVLRGSILRRSEPLAVSGRCGPHVMISERHEIPAEPALPPHDARAGGDSVGVCRSGARCHQAAACRVRPRALCILCGPPLPHTYTRVFGVYQASMRVRSDVQFLLPKG